MNIKTFLKEEYDFDTPDWWECQWRRVACGLVSCPFCHRMLKDEQRHKFKSQDPDSIESALEDVGNHLAETMEMLRQMAEAEGVDLENLDENELPPQPDPEELMRDARYQQAWEWSQAVARMLQVAALNDEPWLKTEAAQDLDWYSTMLPVKIHRQLGSIWDAENGQGERDVDYHYTRYIIGEIIHITKDALKVLEENDPILEMHFKSLRLDLKELEELLIKL